MKKTSIVPIIISLLIAALIVILVVFFPDYAKSTVIKPLLDIARHILG